LPGIIAKRADALSLPHHVRISCSSQSAGINVRRISRALFREHRAKAAIQLCCTKSCLEQDDIKSVRLLDFRRSWCAAASGNHVGTPPHRAGWAERR
jgi:hypothetical protein